MPSVKPPSKINNGKFETVKRLGAGCFGEVYRGKNTETDAQVAIKFENRDGRSAPQLEHEGQVLQALSKDMDPRPQGIAECQFFGQEGNFNVLVMEILGKSLEDHVQGCKGKLTVKTTVLIAQQVLQRIEYLHSKGYVHRDIKPENFMFGVGNKIHHVYIIDFGLSKLYWDKTRNAHAQFRQKLSLTGTARYASINAHKGIEQSRRDDLEAIGHMLFYFLRGALPWSGLDAKTQEEKYRKICEKKENTPIDQLNTGFPKQFDQYLDYCRKLQFPEKPDYTMLHGLMKACREEGQAKEGQAWQDHHYTWLENKDVSGLTAVIPRPEKGLLQPDDKTETKAPKGCFCFCGKSSVKE